MQIVIDIPKEIYNYIHYEHIALRVCDSHQVAKAIANGAPLPKGHGRLIDENYLLGILLCEDYETCIWRNCSECNREKCIKRRDILDASTIIEADTEREE